ncbi:helix-turn-helix transcriptional regulator [Candidatus Neomarinimicrobiota bacterium]
MNTKPETVESSTFIGGRNGEDQLRVHDSEIGARLRKVRIYLGESKTAFAHRIGLGRDDLINSERGFSDLPAEALSELERMGISLTWLLNRSGVPRA